MTSIIEDHIRLRTDFNDAGSAVEFMHRLTGAENFALVLRDVGHKEMPAEIVDLGHGRSLKSTIALTWVEGKGPESSDL